MSILSKSNPDSTSDRDWRRKNGQPIADAPKPKNPPKGSSGVTRPRRKGKGK